ncbi:RHS repeat-associated core domain-containing protein [Aquimarina longa]|uniref:RHS repeat-associated core domain-containing protein n=1 Tax=Aquimarina longa TaxID=1080221 RepID=UPI0009EBBB28|nr:RHS repeat-associated core domain-containing protein [Aquimarina longa]
MPFLYQGQYFDEETELAYNRYRYYAADEGVYISQDPIGLFGMNPTMYAYVSDSNKFIDVFGLNVQTGANRTHVKYSGIKDGKPYHGYASAPIEDGLTGDDIVNRRYGGDFSDFDVAPEVDYIGEGVEGKRTARGLEQRGFEADGGLDGTSNKQNPVGPNNQNRQKYLDAADAHNKKKVKASCG